MISPRAQFTIFTPGFILANAAALSISLVSFGTGLWRGGDQAVIDGAVNGSASLVGRISGLVRHWQTGALFQYALVMALGIFGLLTWQLWPYFSGLLR